MSRILNDEAQKQTHKFFSLIHQQYSTTYDSRLQCETYLCIPTIIRPQHIKDDNSKTIQILITIKTIYWMWNIIKNTCSICKHELIAHTNIINMLICIVLMIGITVHYLYTIEWSANTNFGGLILKKKTKIISVLWIGGELVWIGGESVSENTKIFSKQVFPNIYIFNINMPRKVLWYP